MPLIVIHFADRRPKLRLSQLRPKVRSTAAQRWYEALRSSTLVRLTNWSLTIAW
ncbi:MAG: hypothetical protein GYB65_24180 [Chloroflexi bacterium]|nr:hypothetical protein [Chloroflexota bacterium]